MAWHFEKLHGAPLPIDAAVKLYQDGFDLIVDHGTKDRLVDWFANDRTKASSLKFPNAVTITNDDVMISAEWTGDIVEMLATPLVGTITVDSTEKIVDTTTKTYSGLYALWDLPKQVTFDGTHVWVTGSDRVYVYKFWGEETGGDPAFDSGDYLDDVLPRLKLVDIVRIPAGSYWVAFGGGHVYVSNGPNFQTITKINVETRVIVGTVSCPATMTSNLVFENGCLWMVEEWPATRLQKLYRFNVSTALFTSTDIPERRQTSRAFIAAPLNGSIYVSNFNNVSVCKFNSSTGAYQATIRTNAFPTSMCTNQDRELFVSSYNGMVTTINTSDDTMSNGHSSIENTKALAAPVGQNRFYAVNSTDRFVVVNRSTKSTYFSDPPIDTNGDGQVDEIPDDWKFSLDQFANYQETHPDENGAPLLTGLNQLYITTEFTYQTWNGSSFDTHTVKPYMFIVGVQNIMCFKLDHSICQTVYLGVDGQAMISSGDDDYMGEIG